MQLYLPRKSKKSSHPFAQFCQGELSHISGTTFSKNGRGLSEICQNSLKISVKQRLEMSFGTYRSSQSVDIDGKSKATVPISFERSPKPKRESTATISSKSGSWNMTENSFRIDRKTSTQVLIEKYILTGRRRMHDTAFDREYFTLTIHRDLDAQCAISVSSCQPL